MTTVIAVENKSMGIEYISTSMKKLLRFKHCTKSCYCSLHIRNSYSTLHPKNDNVGCISCSHGVQYNNDHYADQYAPKLSEIRMRIMISVIIPRKLRHIKLNNKRKPLIKLQY